MAIVCFVNLGCGIHELMFLRFVHSCLDGTIWNIEGIRIVSCCCLSNSVNIGHRIGICSHIRSTGIECCIRSTEVPILEVLMGFV